MTVEMPTTEIVTCGLKPGGDIGDPSNNAAVILKEIASTLSKQDGFQQVQFGMQIENPDTISLMINWDSIDSHKAFMSSSAYGPFFQSFASIIASPPKIVHADFEPSPSALAQALAAPVTEIATFYFDGSEPSDYLSGVTKFRDVLEKEQSHGYIGSAMGITHEQDLEKDGKKGKAAVVAIGWKSVEDHLKFREHELFKENIGSLRNGAVGAEIVHVQFMAFVPDA